MHLAAQTDVDGENDLLDRRETKKLVRTHVPRTLDQLLAGEADGGAAFQNFLIPPVRRRRGAPVYLKRCRPCPAPEFVRSLPLLRRVPNVLRNRIARGPGRLSRRRADRLRLVGPEPYVDRVTKLAPQAGYYAGFDGGRMLLCFVCHGVSALGCWLLAVGSWFLADAHLQAQRLQVFR